ncbi:putative virion structural protein [Erwinia phage Wellington]|uniref:Putative virion structural protein n=1 Tax=Erwinia phage Wellington TaxID=2267653 RepID=A0A345BL72_9CAUD|nr:putative virion structural protein [Erwinia phage Wellington]AXF51193.1 putative virion structural protein [Erwinia phage Wellington]
MSNETENDPGYDPNTPEDSGYSNPNNADAVPSVAGYIDARRSTANPNTAFNFGDELTAWTSRLRLLSGQGLAAQRMTNPLMGFNHRMASSPVPINKEYGGLTFFTRPDFNLEFDNLANSRRFSNMAAQPKGSLDYSILAALDPDFELGFSDSPRNANGQRKNRLGTPFHPDIPFDNLQAFIPLLSTQLMSLSAPPDESVDVWTSQEGLMREQWGMVDSTNEVNNGYTVSASLNNPYGDPIMRMMSVWLEYMAGVKMGKFKPKIRNSIQRRMDYFSRIYGIRYDALGNISRFWTMCVGFPTNNNAGSMAQVDNSKPSLDDDTTVTINWQMFGARYNDPLYMEMFNRTVAIFNPDMTPDPRQETFTPMGGNSLVPIPAELLPLFNYYGYPYLDSVRRRITWYVYQADYRTVLTKAGILR